MPSIICAGRGRFTESKRNQCIKMAEARGLFTPKKKKKKRKSNARKTAEDAVRISTRLSWGTKLWFGKHKGRRLNEVPPAYLLWLHRNCQDTKSPPIQGLLLWIGAHNIELRRMVRSQPIQEHTAELREGARQRLGSTKRAYPEQSSRLPVLTRSEPKGMA